MHVIFNCTCMTCNAKHLYYHVCFSLGFKVVTDQINAEKKRDLLWIIAGLSFMMSGVLDNLTTTIVMVANFEVFVVLLFGNASRTIMIFKVSLIKKLIDDPEDRKLFGATIVIAANAGGAWTPIGDITTTMLWNSGQITALPIMKVTTNLLVILYLRRCIASPCLYFYRHCFSHR